MAAASARGQSLIELVIVLLVLMTLALTFASYAEVGVQQLRAAELSQETL